MGCRRAPYVVYPLNGLIDLDRATVSDPNGILVGYTSTANGWIVEVNTGVARNTPDAGVTFAIPAYDSVLGGRLHRTVATQTVTAWSKLNAAALFASVPLYIGAGLSTNPACSGAWGYAGVDFSTGSPRGRISSGVGGAATVVLAAGILPQIAVGSILEYQGVLRGAGVYQASGGTAAMGSGVTGSSFGTGDLWFFLAVMPSAAYAGVTQALTADFDGRIE